MDIRKVKKLIYTAGARISESRSPRRESVRISVPKPGHGERPDHRGSSAAAARSCGRPRTATARPAPAAAARGQVRTDGRHVLQRPAPAQNRSSRSAEVKAGDTLCVIEAMKIELIEFGVGEGRE